MHVHQGLIYMRVRDLGLCPTGYALAYDNIIQALYLTMFFSLAVVQELDKPHQPRNPVNECCSYS